jgi:hypothetical protein
VTSHWSSKKKERESYSLILKEIVLFFDRLHVSWLRNLDKSIYIVDHRIFFCHILTSTEKETSN